MNLLFNVIVFIKQFYNFDLEMSCWQRYGLACQSVSAFVDFLTIVSLLYFFMLPLIFCMNVSKSCLICKYSFERMKPAFFFNIGMISSTLLE